MKKMISMLLAGLLLFSGTVCAAGTEMDEQIGFCLDCGSPAPKGSQYCPLCGIKFGSWRCSRCSKVYGSDVTFCPEDGTPRHAPGYWVCPECGRYNSVSVLLCGQDGTAAEESEILSGTAGERQNNRQQPMELSGQVTCLDCGTSVTKGAYYCTLCGIKMGSWRCSRCSKVYGSDVTICPEDGTPRHEPGQWTCSKCGKSFSVTRQFCAEDGTPMTMALTEDGFCLECGAAMEAGDRICPNCGITAGDWKCAVCGQECESNTTFCPIDGTPRHEPGK